MYIDYTILTHRFYAIERFLVCYIVADNFMFFAIDSSAGDDRQIDPLATWLPQRREKGRKAGKPAAERKHEGRARSGKEHFCRQRNQGTRGKRRDLASTIQENDEVVPQIQKPEVTREVLTFNKTTIYV